MNARPYLETTSRMALTIAVVAIAVFGMQVGAHAAQPTATTQAEMKSPRSNFLATFEGFRKQIDEASKGVTDATRVIGDVSKMTVQNKRAELDDLREKLLGLSRQMDGDGALAQAIDQFDSWTVAQRKRIELRRDDLGNQRAVEGLLKTYEIYGKDISRARELVNSYKSNVIQLLKELSAGEALASEYLLAEEAGKALETLNAALSVVRTTIEGFRTKLHDFGLNGPST